MASAFSSFWTFLACSVDAFKRASCSFSFVSMKVRSDLVYCSLFLRFPTVALRSSASCATLFCAAVLTPVLVLGALAVLVRSASSFSFLCLREATSFSSHLPAALLLSLVRPPVMVPALLITPPLLVTALTLLSLFPSFPKQSSLAASRSSQTTVFPTA